MDSIRSRARLDLELRVGALYADIFCSRGQGKCEQTAGTRVYLAITEPGDLALEHPVRVATGVIPGVLRFRSRTGCLSERQQVRHTGSSKAIVSPEKRQQVQRFTALTVSQPTLTNRSSYRRNHCRRRHLAGRRSRKIVVRRSRRLRHRAETTVRTRSGRSNFRRPVRDHGGRQRTQRAVPAQTPHTRQAPSCASRVPKPRHTPHFPVSRQARQSGRFVLNDTPSRYPASVIVTSGSSGAPREMWTGPEQGHVRFACLQSWTLQMVL